MFIFPISGGMVANDTTIYQNSKEMRVSNLRKNIQQHENPIPYSWLLKARMKNMKRSNCLVVLIIYRV